MPIQLTLVNVGWGVKSLPDGTKMLHFLDRDTSISVNIPLGEDVADELAAQLGKSSIKVARVLPAQS
jgi:hypothetical protein